MQRVQHGEEEHRRARHRRRDVAEHVDLRPPRAHRAWYLRTTGTPPVSSDARIVRRTSTCVAALAPAVLLALRLQPPLELGDDAVHGGEVLQRPGGQRAVELVERARGRQRARCARSARARARGAAAARSGAARRAAGRRGAGRLGGRSGCGSARRPSARRMRWTSTPMTPEPSPWRPNAAIASRARSRIARLVAVAQRRGDLLAQRLEVELAAPASPAPALVGVVLLARRPRAARPARRRGRRSGRRRARRRAGPRATWPASRRAPRGSRRARSSRPRSSAANASSSSLVPTATPSPRSSSPNSRRRAAKPPSGRLTAPSGPPSFTPTRSATTSRSVRCLTMTDIVSRNVCVVDVLRRRAAAARAPSRSTRRSTAAS